MLWKVWGVFLFVFSPLCSAGASYWYYVSERADVLEGKVVYKYSRVLACDAPIQGGSAFKAGFVGNDAVGPFASYQEADAARSIDLNIAISAKKEIQLAEAVCN